ncbi:MAG TPA: hypothetical protein VFE51_16125 [Verrucomicrobiae bacterium]|nr:hypothetical protein [Verrucomicrobiae bacterium]
MNMLNDFQNNSLTSASPFVAACAASCQKLLTGIQNIRRVILSEFRESGFGQDHLLQLALNEAEALAHQTGFPLLTFPTLAREKLQSVVAWRLRQQRVRHTSFARLTA